MFTLKFFKNSLINVVNSNRNLIVANSRSIQLFRRPNEDKKDEEIEELESEKFAFDEENEEDPELKIQKIENMRNKSRLQKGHRNILYNRMPYTENKSWHHETLKYKRMM